MSRLNDYVKFDGGAVAVPVVSINGLGRIVLGQGPPRIRIVVQDRRGSPMPGVGVVVLSPDNIGEGKTDDDGAVIVDLPEGRTEAIVIAGLPEGDVRQRVMLSPLGMQTITFRSVRRHDGPIITIIEGAAFSLGVGMIVTGSISGKIIGNILAGIGGSVTAASVYSAVSRRV